MKLNRTELDKGLNKKLFDIDTNHFISDGLTFYKNKIHGKLSIESGLDGYNIRGYLDIPIKQTCDRCLAVFNDLRNTEFHFLLTENDELLQKEFEGVIHFAKNDDKIDLTPQLRDHILLEEDMKTLCSKNCKGLCSNCGINLNEEDCNCYTEITDSPWEALKNL